MSTASTPDASGKSRRRVIVSEDLPLTMLTAVATTLAMNALGLGRELLYVGVALSPVIADVIKNAACGLRKRWLLLLTALLALLGTSGRALAARLRARRDWAVPWHSVLATAALSVVLTVALFTVPELARGKAILADRGTTFFDADRETEDTVPPRLRVPESFVVLSADPTRVDYRVTATDGVDGRLTPRCSSPDGAVFPHGRTTVHCSATDANGNRSEASFAVTVKLAPSELVLMLPPAVEVEAAGPDGARARYAASAADGRGEPLVPTCVPRSGTLFALGVTRVECAATDAAGRRTRGGFDVVVRDGEPPTLTLPSGLNGKTRDEAGRRVVFDVSAVDRVDAVVTPTCTPPSGSQFPIGSTTVSCTAADARGNRASGSFTVSVELGRGDPEPPVLSLPADLMEEATSAAGARVVYRASARDTDEGTVETICSHPSGATFPIGRTTVRCSAQDSDGDRARGSFTVTVADTTPPALELTSHPIVEATSAAGAPVAYRASTRDRVDGLLVPTCSPPPGSTFELGTTIASCSATDAHGNSASGTLTVSVVDTTAPALKLPDDITAEATDARGRVVRYEVSALDAVTGLAEPRCSQPPGRFRLGTTTVICTVADARGNSTSGSFTVSVVDTTGPTLELPGDFSIEAAYSRARQGWGATITYSASATDSVDGRVRVACTPPSGTFVAVSETTEKVVECSAVDAHGNTASRRFTVTIRMPEQS